MTPRVSFTLVDNGQLPSLIGSSTADWPVGSGNTIGANAIIGKSTYLGDTNLDGFVRGADYVTINSQLGYGVGNPLETTAKTSQFPSIVIAAKSRDIWDLADPITSMLSGP